MKSIKWLVPLLVLVSMMLVVTSVSAQENGDEEEDSRDGIVGEVISAEIDEDGSGTVVVLTAEGEEVAVELSAGEYDLKTPGSTDGSIEEGDQVALLVEDGSAVQVLVKPDRPLNPPVTGSVVSIVDRVLTILKPNGTTQIVQLGPKDDPPALGDLVTTFIDDASDTDDASGGPSVSRGLVRADEVRERLNRFIDEELNDASGTDDEGGQGRAKRIEKLAGLLETHASKHVDVLSGLLEREDLPAQGKAGIAKALANAQGHRADALQRASNARSRAGRPADLPGGRPEGRGQGGRPDNSSGDVPDASDSIDGVGGRPEQPGSQGNRP
ncbi:MAG: hypothetical protein V3S98_08835 [Dehalococcoidia bacterium]